MSDAVEDVYMVAAIESSAFAIELRNILNYNRAQPKLLIIGSRGLGEQNIYYIPPALDRWE